MNKKVFSFLRWIAAVILVPVIFQSCDSLYRESLDDCYGGVSVILKVDPATTGASDAEAGVQHAVIYVFDSEGNFLERRETEVNKEEMLWYPEHNELSVVGWLNKCEKYDVPAFEEGGSRTEGSVALLTTSRANVECDIPTDLFYGDVDIAGEINDYTLIQREVYASRLVGSMVITVRGLREYAGVFDDNFSITVGPTYRSVDFFGKYRHNEASHMPSTKFASSGDFVTTIFNMMPTGSGNTVISIYHNDLGLVYQTSTDKYGKKIGVVADRTENVLIDFTSEVQVTVIRGQWQEMHVWGKDIN